MAQFSLTLEEIALWLGAELRGDAQTRITGLATLQDAGEGDIAFLSNPKYARHLSATGASAVLVSEETAQACPTNVLVLENPYLGYARLSHRFDPAPEPKAGIHPSAVIDPSATVAEQASIGPNVVIGARVTIDEGVEIGANCSVGDDSSIGRDSLIRPNVSIYHGVRIGERVIIHSGSVIGSDGFGFANEKGVWHKIAQIGGVVIGNDVEIGAGCTIDRGALNATEIGNGVKLDNQIQIAHNVVIGENTAMAANTAVAGSTTIGAYCVIGGASAISGHLELADGVHLTGMAMVTRSLKEPGVYSSGTGVESNRQWRKSVVRFRQLDDMARRLKELEKKLGRDE
ncbi:UDP-3-O-(3-hydroxymyristoyl)glucosamine N-acyltransferase [Marinobacteraceae bacterium S3BR75-40.1]